MHFTLENWPRNCKIVQAGIVQSILQIVLPNPPTQSSVTYNRLLKAVSGWVLSISKVRGFTISLGNTFQHSKEIQSF